MSLVDNWNGAGIDEMSLQVDEHRNLKTSERISVVMSNFFLRFGLLPPLLIVTTDGASMIR